MGKESRLCSDRNCRRREEKRLKWVLTLCCLSLGLEKLLLLLKLRRDSRHRSGLRVKEYRSKDDANVLCLRPLFRKG